MFEYHAGLPPELSFAAWPVMLALRAPRARDPQGRARKLLRSVLRAAGDTNIARVLGSFERIAERVQRGRQSRRPTVRQLGRSPLQEAGRAVNKGVCPRLRKECRVLA